MHTTSATVEPPGDGGVLLADVLSINAVSSGLTGLVLLLGAPWLDGAFGVHAGVLAFVGLGLVGFAEAIVAALARPSQLRPVARWIIAGDVLWVAMAALIVPADVLTALGDVLLVAVSVAVADFAIGQAIGLRRAGSTTELGVRDIVMTGSRQVPAPAEQAWKLVADANGYAAFAPGIAETSTDGELREGMHRRCVDDRGRTWSEACTLVEPGRHYRMEVDTTTYPLRHRMLLHRFGMTWTVTPTAEGSTIELMFSGGVKLGVLGRLAMAALARSRVHERILDTYAAELPTGSSTRTGISRSVLR